MSSQTETTERRRKSVYLDDYQHSNPIPAACRVDNVIYSGVIHGIDRSSDTPAQSLSEQARLMFHRLGAVVQAAGASIDDVIKVTMWMSDRSERETVNRFWLELFPDPSDRPARHTINAQLDGEQLIQCDFVAVVPDNARGDLKP